MYQNYTVTGGRTFTSFPAFLSLSPGLRVKKSLSSFIIIITISVRVLFADAFGRAHDSLLGIARSNKNARHCGVFLVSQGYFNPLNKIPRLNGVHAK